MAEARKGAESSAPAVEMDAVSMNCRRVDRNKRPLFPKKSAASRLLAGFYSAPAPEPGIGVSPSDSAFQLFPPKRGYVPLSVAD
jgi:hypothetical protein